MTGAPQGETGGAQAGNAESPAAQQAANIATAELGLRMANAKADLDVKKAQIKDIEASAEAKRAEAGLTSEQKITEIQGREAKIRDIFEQGKSKWIANLRALYEDSTEGGENDNLEATDEFFGEHSIIGRRMRNQEFANDIILKQAKAMEAIGNKKAADALAALNTEKKKYLYKEVMIAAQHADAHAMEAAAKKLATEWETGEYTNWKTWVDVGMDGIKTLMSVMGVVSLTKAPAALKRAFENRQNGGKVATVLDSAGKPISWEQW